MSAGDVHCVEGRSRNIGPDNGDIRRNQVAIFEKKWHPRNADDHDRVKTYIRVLVVQKISRPQRVGLVRPPCQIQKVGFDFKRLRESSKLLAEGI